jgi:serine/threonine-protein kinase
MGQNDSKIPVATILVGKYKVLREIGRGGMAAVYEAEHLALAKKVAIKILAAELTASKIVSERFFREARAAASVKSPHIVDVYDSGRLEDGRPFIVMELLEGESLYDRMARVRIIDPLTTTKIIADCAKGLAKAHAIGIVHRDLKPENIFLLKGEDGVEYSKLLDFGLAKFYAPVQPGDEKTARLTREGAVFGTPAYMSPEQVKGQGSVDQRADLWALGCMAYECLTGRPVWNTEQGVAMTFAAIATEPLPVPTEVYPDVPFGFDAWFRKALERDPAKRFQTATELADALAVALGSSPASSPDMQALRTGPSTRDVLRASGRDVARDASGRDVGRDASNRDVTAGVDVSGQHTAIRDGSGPISDGFGPSSSAQRLAAGPLTGAIPAAQGSAPRESPAGMLQNTGAIARVEPVRISPFRYAIGALAMLGAFSAAGVTWVRYLRPQVMAPVVDGPAPTAEPSSSASSQPIQPREDQKWAKPLTDGQRLLASGDLGAAQKKFKEAHDAGAGLIAKGLSDQAKAAADGRGACRVVALSRPRLFTTTPVTNAGRPYVVPTPNTNGALVVWTDDHEQAGRERAYSITIDEFGAPSSPLRELTPEGVQVVRPVVLPLDDKFALFYWDKDKGGKAASVRARILDQEGRIDEHQGESKLVASGKSASWPAYEATPSGFVVAWQDDRDGNDDLFFRQLTKTLDSDGGEVRLTDYAQTKGRTIGVRLPSVTVAANTLLIAYRLDRDRGRGMMRMRVPFSAPELRKGLEERPENMARPDREVGEVRMLHDDKADAPSTVCGTDGCFVAWHQEPKGAWLARIDPATGAKIWAKPFAPNGTRPSLAVGPKGDVMVTFYEQGKVRIAPVSRDSVGVVSVFAKMAGDPPRPSIAAGKTRGEWFVAWLDVEGQHLEPYVAKLACPR